MTHQYQMSNVIGTNYFTTFLQIVIVANFYWFSFGSATDIIFSITNNYTPHQQFIKKFVALPFSISD